MLQNTANYSNYSVALAAVNDYALASHIPYRHILLDSWWYYKEEPKKGVSGALATCRFVTAVVTSLLSESRS